MTRSSYTPKKPLNKQQQLFCSFYCGQARYNGTRAAIMAGYSERTAYSQAHNLLRHPDVLAEVDRLHSERCADQNELARFVLEEHSRLAQVDMTSIAEWGTKRVLDSMGIDENEYKAIKAALDAHEEVSMQERELIKAVEEQRTVDFVRLFKSGDLPPHISCAVQEVNITGNGGLKIKLYDKQKSLDSLARMMGMFDDSIRTVGEGHENLLQRLLTKEKEGK